MIDFDLLTEDSQFGEGDDVDPVKEGTMAVFPNRKVVWDGRIHPPQNPCNYSRFFVLEDNEEHTRNRLDIPRIRIFESRVDD